MQLKRVATPVLIILLIVILFSCKGKKIYLPEKEKFLFIRSDKPFKGKVKSVVQTEGNIDTGKSSNTDPNWSQKDEYYFSEEGLLYKWTSWSGAETDLKYKNNGSGYIRTNFVSDKTIKEQRSEWQNKDTFHILKTVVKIDGKVSKSIEKTYDGKFTLLSERDENSSGEISVFMYTYKNGLLDEVTGAGGGAGYSMKYSYGSGSDTTRSYWKSEMPSTTIKFYNESGDINRIIYGKTASESEYTYEYDQNQNWTVRKEINKGSSQITIIKRKITYY